MSKSITIETVAQALELENSIIISCDSTKLSIQKLLNEKSGFESLHDLKFFQVGKDPLEERSLNFIEQLNQTFTYLVSIKAVIYLLNTYPHYAPYTLNLGTHSGFDIASLNGEIVAEIFAATAPTSNDKLNKDTMRVSTVVGATHRFVFFYSPKPYNNLTSFNQKYPNVTIIQLDVH